MSELENETVDEHLRGLTYAEILDSLKEIKRVSAETYIHALCLALKREHINMSNAEIRERVRQDCLSIDYWSETYIDAAYNWPKWIKKAYGLNTNQLEEVSNSPAEQQRQQSLSEIAEFFSHIEQEIEEAKRRQEEQEAGGVTYGPARESRRKRKRQLSPLELYVHHMKGASAWWKSLTPTGKLIAADTVDVLNEHIRPSRDFRLRLLKGLGDLEYASIQRTLIWMDKMIQDTLKLCRDINREEKATLTK